MSRFSNSSAISDGPQTSLRAFHNCSAISRFSSASHRCAQQKILAMHLRTKTTVDPGVQRTEERTRAPERIQAISSPQGLWPYSSCL